jgi:proton-translocating NADH-quinone oxidoreductase chain N
MNFSTLFINDIKIILPEFFLATSVLVLVIHGAILAASPTYNYPLINKSISWLSVLILTWTLILILNNPINFRIIFNNTFIYDDLTVFSQSIILISSIACLIMSQEYIKNYRLNSYEYYLLILFAILGLMLLTSSYDLISAYLAIEMQSLSFYTLAAFKRKSAFSTEAGLKYFILGAFSSGLILFGSSLIYGFTGVTNLGYLFCLMNDVNTHISNVKVFFEPYYYNTVIVIANVFIAVGLLFKLSAAPFHMWSPDVYEGSPTSSAALFAIVPKIAVLVIFARIFQNSLFSTVYWWQSIVLFCAMCSVLIGSFVALKQRKFKRLMAYSAISHVGYLLISFGLGTSIGLQSLFFYIFIYMITSICIWSILMSFELHSSTSRNLSDLSLLIKANPILAVTFAIALFSLAGVPPLAGFYAKMQIFLASLESSMYFIAVISIISSVISTFYYIRIIKTVYFEKVSDWNFYQQINQGKSLILGLSTFLIVLLFLSPNLLSLCAYKMSVVLV